MPFDETTSIIDARMLQEALGSKSDARSACFIFLTGSQAGRMCKITSHGEVIGRSVGATICVPDDGVSREHARISAANDGSVLLEDLGSTNGTFINGERIESRLLQDGDKIELGGTTILKFSYQDSLDEDFQRRQYESATRDALTGCHNKRYFSERLPSEIAFAQRHEKMLSLAILDLDHFKAINDTYGHQAGDHVLKTFSELVMAEIRTDDIAARYGGEEFALIMRETGHDGAFLVVERIRRRVAAAKFMYEGKEMKVTVSIGLVVRHGRELGTEQMLVKEADDCLYKAKGEGRNRTVCHQ
jgi:two-component system, cell cycle response regulator